MKPWKKCLIFVKIKEKSLCKRDTHEKEMFLADEKPLPADTDRGSGHAALPCVNTTGKTALAEYKKVHPLGSGKFPKPPGNR